VTASADSARQTTKNEAFFLFPNYPAGAQQPKLNLAVRPAAEFGLLKTVRKAG
jgi:hypothetical protein